LWLSMVVSAPHLARFLTPTKDDTPNGILIVTVAFNSEHCIKWKINYNCLHSGYHRPHFDLLPWPIACVCFITTAEVVLGLKVKVKGQGQSEESCGHNHMHTKGQGQRLLGSNDRAEMNGWMHRGDCRVLSSYCIRERNPLIRLPPPK